MENTQRLELKILALKEGFRSKVASTVEEYEDRIAELRIELTEQSQQNQELQQLREQDAATITSLNSLLEERNSVQEEDGKSEGPPQDSDPSN